MPLAGHPSRVALLESMRIEPGIRHHNVLQFSFESIIFEIETDVCMNFCVNWMFDRAGLRPLPTSFRDLWPGAVYCPLDKNRLLCV